MKKLHDPIRLLILFEWTNQRLALRQIPPLRTNTNNSDARTYTITITATDGHSDTTDASGSFTLYILEDTG